MRISKFLALVLLFLFPISNPCLAESLILPQNTPVNVYFSPKGGCTLAHVGIKPYGAWDKNTILERQVCLKNMALVVWGFDSIP
jgi:hypothetical protein